ncbi:unnamed protein product [Chrysoparadoxa australica]
MKRGRSSLGKTEIEGRDATKVQDKRPKTLCISPTPSSGGDAGPGSADGAGAFALTPIANGGRTSPESFGSAWRKTAEAVMRGVREMPVPTSGKHRYAMVCSSNINRSVMGQIVLEAAGLACCSYGVGTSVKLPGKDRHSPKVFRFGTPYLSMHDNLAAEDKRLFGKSGVLSLLQRDAQVKRHPERWQDVPTEEAAEFDVVLCFEHRIFDAVVDDMQNRDPENFKPVHLIAMSVKDSPVEAEKASKDVIKLCQQLEELDDLEEGAGDVVASFESQSKLPLLHQICHL